MYMKAKVLATLIAIAIAIGVVLFVFGGNSRYDSIEGSGGSCLPGTEECIESCALGEPAYCPNPGGTPRTCDCTHPWNQP